VQYLHHKSVNPRTIRISSQSRLPAVFLLLRFWRLSRLLSNRNKGGSFQSISECASELLVSCEPSPRVNPQIRQSSRVEIIVKPPPAAKQRTGGAELIPLTEHLYLESWVICPTTPCALQICWRTVLCDFHMTYIFVIRLKFWAKVIVTWEYHLRSSKEFQ